MFAYIFFYSQSWNLRAVLHSHLYLVSTPLDQKRLTEELKIRLFCSYFFFFFFFLFCTLMHLEQYVLPLVWNLWKRRCTLTRKSLKTVPIKTNQSLHYIMTSFFVLQSSADGVVPKNFFCLFVFFWCQKKRLCHL